jgi:tetratricopeptide (TPR) repeat protein
MPIEKAKVLDFFQETTSPTFAYAVLDAMMRRSNTPPSDHMMSVMLKRFGPITDRFGLGYVFRYEYARSLWQAGKGHEAVTQFRELHADTLRHGVLPPIDTAFRDVLQMPIGDGPKFIGFTRKTLDDTLKEKHYGLAFQLAKQMEQLGDEALSDEIFTTILDRASDKERNFLTLVSIQFQAQRQNFVLADRLLQKVLVDKKLAQRSDLWRLRSELTAKLGQTSTSIACMEKALELEYADLPELVNLESIRKDYRSLMNSYQNMANVLGPMPSKSWKGLQVKVMRAADRWRLIDSDSSEPNQLAGKIFHTLGLSDLAWDYWTTPIDLHPAESRPWLELAETLKSAADLDGADRAFAFAFEAEPTNADILWKRSQNCVRMGQADRARQLYRQIADGQWQERFNATVEQARGLAMP